MNKQKLANSLVPLISYSTILLAVTSVKLESKGYKPEQKIAQPQYAPATPLKQSEAWGAFKEFASDVGAGQLGWQTRCALFSGTQCSAAIPANTNQSPQPDRMKPDIEIHGSSRQIVNPKCPHCVSQDLYPGYNLSFNLKAANYISVYLKPRQNRQPRNLPNVSLKAVVFPVGSLITRAAWLVIPADHKETVKAHFFDPLFFRLDPQQPNAGDVSSFPQYVINMKDSSCTSGNVYVKPGGEIPIGCFFHKKASELSKTSRALMDFATLNDNDTVILVAVHMMKRTKNDHDWGWYTFWWQPEVDNSASTAKSSVKYPCNEITSSSPCRSLPLQLKHYAMDTNEMPLNANSNVPVIFNPYLDGNRPNNVNTSCLVCHRFAASPQLDGASNTIKLGNQGIVTVQELKGSVCNYLTGKFETDQLWSLSARLEAVGVGRGTRLSSTNTSFCPSARNVSVSKLEISPN